MLERATLRLDTGREVRVEVAPEDLGDREIVVRRTPSEEAQRRRTLPDAIDAHLARAGKHPSGTTERLLGNDAARRR